MRLATSFMNTDLILPILTQGNRDFKLSISTLLLSLNLRSRLFVAWGADNEPAFNFYLTSPLPFMMSLTR